MVRLRQAHLLRYHGKSPLHTLLSFFLSLPSLDDPLSPPPPIFFAIPAMILLTSPSPSLKLDGLKYAGLDVKSHSGLTSIHVLIQFLLVSTNSW